MLIVAGKPLEYWQVVYDLEYLHPFVRLPVEAVQRELSDAFARGQLRYRLHVFETWRSPARQDFLFNGAGKVTRVRAWESAHQYGLAADFVGRTKSGWTWDVPASDWALLRRVAEDHGLAVPAASWDPGHVEWPHWPDLRDVLVGF